MVHFQKRFPAHSVDSWGIETFPTREAWEAEIRSLESRVFARGEHLAVIMTIPRITSTIDIKVKVDEPN